MSKSIRYVLLTKYLRKRLCVTAVTGSEVYHLINSLIKLGEVPVTISFRNVSMVSVPFIESFLLRLFREHGVETTISSINIASADDHCKRLIKLVVIKGVEISRYHQRSVDEVLNELFDSCPSQPTDP